MISAFLNSRGAPLGAPWRPAHMLSGHENSLKLSIGYIVAGELYFYLKEILFVGEFDETTDIPADGAGCGDIG